ncbi:hypothetical protein NE237_000281 [Protea cynaroides]|uniref:Senescence regulator n=1 Tax=Protea cynaroides TaxID=273540 RepID=A0A9Q0QX03_9MAGN|nr:hypothetical protein NE237_000281 [Protea cynaroides]
MAEEFQESDVIWSEESYCKEDRLLRSVFQDDNFDPAVMMLTNNSASAQQNSRQSRRKSKESSSQYHSFPVNIPCNSKGNSNNRSSNNDNTFLHYSDSNESDDELEDSELVPPHLMIAGRYGRQMAFSVCTGNGRTLKGRDLSKVRNSILRLTGFLET